jgi:hypothetical protein
MAGLLLFAACQQTPVTQLRQRVTRLGPTVRATVITVQTTLQPANRTTAHTVFIADSKARSTDDAERWCLYDTSAKTVTFVNDLERTWRREPMSALIARRRAVLRRPADRELPRAQFESTGAQREILGSSATQSIIRLGGYQREIWFAQHPLIPDDLFAMMHGSVEPSTRLAAIVAGADEGLLSARGFPFHDRAELPYGKSKMTVERVVTAIQQKDVSSSLFQIPAGYEEIKAPVARRPPASSRPPDQTAPGAESQPSATTRTTP